MSLLICFFYKLVIQAKHEHVNFSFKKYSKYTIQEFRLTDSENLIRMLFRQVGDDILTLCHNKQWELYKAEPC